MSFGAKAEIARLKEKLVVERAKLTALKEAAIELQNHIEEVADNSHNDSWFEAISPVVWNRVSMLCAEVTNATEG